MEVELRGSLGQKAAGRLGHFDNSTRRLEEYMAPSDVVLVLGMHRSGTSAVAGALTMLGGGKPKRLMAPHSGNPRGFFESTAFMELHDDLLASAGSNWKDWRPFNPEWHKSPIAVEFRRRAKTLMAEEFDGSPLPVLKDPRICRFAPFWFDVLHEMEATPHIALPIRSPLDVAHSLKVLQGLPLNHGLLMWLRHVLDAEVFSRSMPRAIFTWREFCTDWRAVCNRIGAETQLSWSRLSDRASFDIDHFLSIDLVHHNTDDEALVAHTAVHEWTLRAYEALLELCRNPHSNSALATLDDVRLLLGQASDIFGRLLIDAEMDLEEACSRAEATALEHDSLKVVHAEVSGRLATAERARDEFAMRLEAAERALEKIAQEKEDLSQALAARPEEAEVQSLRQELLRREGALMEVSADFGTSERARDDLAARLEAAERARDEFATRLEAAERALEKMAQEKEDLSQALAARPDEAEVQNLRQELLRREGALMEVSADFGTSERARDDLATRLEAAERALEKMAQEKEDLSQALAARLDEAEIQSLKQELQRRESALMEISADFGTSERARDDLAARLEAAERTLAKIGEEKYEVEAQLTISLEERTAIEVRSSELNIELENERQRSARAEIDASETARQLTSADNLNQELQQRLKTFEAEIRRVQKAASDKANVSARIISETQLAYESRLRALNAKIVNYEAALAVLGIDTRRAGLFKWRSNVRHYRSLATLVLNSGLFDVEYYVEQFPLIKFAGVSAVQKRSRQAAEHYLKLGFYQGGRPNRFFDSNWYLAQYEDVRTNGINPLVHFIQHGWREGRNPGPDFETSYYLTTNPDVTKSDINPLLHYILHGRNEGRAPRKVTN